MHLGLRRRAQPVSDPFKLPRWDPEEQRRFTGAQLNLPRVAPRALGHRRPRVKPHVVPVGYRYEVEADAIDVGGLRPEQSERWRDLESNPEAPLVVDDVVSVDPWLRRGIEVRGRAQVHQGDRERLGPGCSRCWIRIRVDRIVGWGLDPDPFRSPNAPSTSWSASLEARSRLLARPIYRSRWSQFGVCEEGEVRCKTWSAGRRPMRARTTPLPCPAMEE
jgi:pyridoxamine 5'-phosphate oxidase family protein